MRRSRSPVQYIPRGKSREKSFSISSLSDCSLGKSPKRSSKYMKNDSRERSYREGHYYKNGSYSKYDMDRNKKVDRSRSPERDTRSYKNDKSQSYKEKPYSSTSTSQKSEDHVQKHKHSALGHKMKEKKPDDRLERLEQMVELLVTNKAGPSTEPSALSTVNPYEFNPRNTSFTTSMWLNRINEDCIDRNYGENDCIQYIQNKMTGLIKAWFKTLDLFDYTWPEIKMLIINTFPDNVDFAATLRLLVNRLKKPEETITQYYFSKMYLLEACKITGANAVSVLIDGLNEPYWQKDARIRNFQNPEVFYTEFLLKLPKFGLQQPTGYHKPSVEEANELPPEKEYVEISYQKPSHVKYHEVVEDLRHNIGNSRLDKQAKIQDTRKCYVCAGLGHIASKCPNSGKCFLCNKRGHIAARCKKANNINVY